jgi:hypothetical protein
VVTFKLTRLGLGSFYSRRAKRGTPGQVENPQPGPGMPAHSEKHEEITVETEPICVICEKPVDVDQRTTLTVRKVRTGSGPRAPQELAHRTCLRQELLQLN